MDWAFLPRLAWALTGILLVFSGPLNAAGFLSGALESGRGLIHAARQVVPPAAPVPVRADRRIVVVGIDKKTQEELGPFGPSYRPYNTLLIERMNQAGIRGAAFDIYFPDYPEWTEATADLAEAAAAGAPVVVAVYAELREGGVFVQKPNDPSIRNNPSIGQGSINFAYETVTSMNGEAAESSDGPVVVVAGSAGCEALVVELLRRVGAVEDGELRKKGFVSRMNTAFSGKPLALEIMHPALGDVQDGEIATVSFLEVLDGMHKETLKDALVLVGVTDWVKDVFENPDPVGAPQIKRLPGVYIHASLMRRILASSESAGGGATGPSVPAEVAPASPARGIWEDLGAAYSQAKEARSRRISAQTGGRAEAEAFLEAMTTLVGTLGAVEAAARDMVFSESIDALPASDQKALKESFTALYSIVPMPSDYGSLVFPDQERAQDVFDRYEGVLDSLANLTAFSLDVSL